MTRRGRILCAAAAGRGLLVVDGTQLLFTAETMWRSATPPTPGMVVDVDVDGINVISVAAVPEGRLALELAGRVLDSARQRGMAVGQVAAARFGLPALVAAAALVAGWFFLRAGSLTTSLGRTDFTFWQALAVVNSGSAGMPQRMAGIGSSNGIYGILTVIALVGPFVRPVWKSRRAYLGGMLPLLVLLLVGWKMWHLGFNSGASADLVEARATGIRDALRHGSSIGVGTYVSGAAAVYFAFVSVRRYFAAATTRA